MRKRTTVIRIFLALSLLTAWVAPRIDGADWIPATRLLPDTTQGFVEIPSAPELKEAFQKTGLGRLLQTEELQGVSENIRKALNEWLSNNGGNITVELRDLLEVTSGEIVLGWMQSNEPRHPYRACILADVRGNEVAATKLLEQLKGDLVQRGADAKGVMVADNSMTVMTLPLKIGKLDVDQLVFGLLNGRLIFTDRQDVMEQLVKSIAAGGVSSCICEAADFTALKAKTMDKHPGQVNWFARPLGMGRILRAIWREGELSQKDVIGLLERQGFDVLQAAGGVLNLAANPYDWVHRFYIYAPGQSGQERFRLASKMLTFPNEPISELPSWVSIEISTATQLNWKLATAFWSLESLIDDIVGDKVFRDSLQGIIEDPDGPQIDIAKDLIGNFEDRIFLLTNNRQPSELDSERTLLTIPLKNEQAVAQLIRKLEESDPDVHRFEHPKYEIWEVRREEDSNDQFSQFQFGQPSVPPVEEERPLLDSWAVAVRNGYLVLATHTSLLVEIFDSPGNEALAEYAAAEKPVREALVALTGNSNVALFRCVRPEIAWRVKYDLLRAGKLKDSDSVLATLLRRAGEELEKSSSQPKKAKADLDIHGNELPPFSFVVPYLGTMGNSLRTTEDGWEGASVMLATENQPTP